MAYSNHIPRCQHVKTNGVKCGSLAEAAERRKNLAQGASPGSG